MSERIRYDTDLLRSRAAEARKYAAEHDDAIDRITNLVNALPDVWEGQSEKKFVAAFQEMATSFQQFGSAMESYARELEAAAERMEAADKRLRAKISMIG